MTVTFEKSTASGRVSAPPSKSMAHRYCICAALSEGCEVCGLSGCDDVMATVSALKQFGADIRKTEKGVYFSGLVSVFPKENTVIDCKESGSTLRFLLPLALRHGKTVRFTGSQRLLERPMTVYRDLCRQQNIFYSKDGQGITVKGILKPGRFTLSGAVSSQFLSGLFFVLPLLDGDSLVEIEGEPESMSYCRMTVKTLGEFGVRVRRIDEKTYFVPGNQTYRNQRVTVEGDYSNAAFLEGFNLLGGKVTVEGLLPDSCQGDRVYRDAFRQWGEHPCFDVSDCPDLAPVYMALGAAKGGVTLTGTRRLALKESNRGVAMAEELAKFGIKVTVEDNLIQVKKGKLLTPVLPLFSHNDHRIAMAVSMLATVTGGKLYGAEAVNKSFPDFFPLLASLGISLKRNSIEEIGFHS